MQKILTRYSFTSRVLLLAVLFFVSATTHAQTATPTPTQTPTRTPTANPVTTAIVPHHWINSPNSNEGYGLCVRSNIDVGTEIVTTNPITGEACPPMHNALMVGAFKDYGENQGDSAGSLEGILSHVCMDTEDTVYNDFSDTPGMLGISVGAMPKHKDPYSTTKIAECQAYVGIQGVASVKSNAEIAGANNVVAANFCAYPSSKNGARTTNGEPDVDLVASVGVIGVVSIEQGGSLTLGTVVDEVAAGNFEVNFKNWTSDTGAVDVNKAYASKHLVTLKNEDAAYNEVYGMYGQILTEGEEEPSVPTVIGIYMDVDTGAADVTTEKLALKAIGGRALIGPGAHDISDDYLRIFQPLSDAQIGISVEYDFAGDWGRLNSSTYPYTTYTVFSLPSPILSSENPKSDGTEIKSVKAIFECFSSYRANQCANVTLYQKYPDGTITSSSTGLTASSSFSTILTPYYGLSLTPGTEWVIENDSSKGGPEKVWVVIDMAIQHATSFTTIRPYFRFHGLVWEFGDVKY
jgi:hypothetical protein